MSGAVSAASGAFIIGFAAILVKATQADLTAIAFYRVLLALPLMALIAWKAHRRILIKAADHRIACIAGIAFALDLFVWHQAIVRIGAGLATVLANTQIFYLVLWSVFRGEEKATLRFFASVILGFLGVVLIAMHGFAIPQNSNQYLWGVLFGLATGICYATYVTALKRFEKSPQPLPAILRLGWATFYCTIALFLLGLFTQISWEVPRSSDWLYLLLLAWGAQTLGWYFISSGLMRLTSAQTGLVLLIQPLTSTVMGKLIFAETLLAQQILGLFLTLTGVYLGLSRSKPKAIKPSV